MQQLQHQQRSGVRWHSGVRDGTGYCCHIARQHRRSSHVVSAASVEQQVGSDVDHLKLIAPDATQLIGNTPMVSSRPKTLQVALLPGGVARNLDQLTQMFWM